MEKRMLGKTGIEVSVIGLGAEHLDGKPPEVVDEVVNASLDNGIDIIDVFMPGTEVRTNIGRALGPRRKNVTIQGHIGSVDLNQQYDISRDPAICRKYFENLLTSLGTDYIDIGMLFFLDSHADIDAVFDNGIVDYARELKEKGVVRAIGASAHNPETARRVVESGVVDMMLFSINPAFDLMPASGSIEEMLGDQFVQRVTSPDPARADFYRLCESKGVGLTVMKTFGAGKLLSAEHTPFEKPLTPAQCIHYALTRPAVASVLLGCQSAAEVESAMAYLKASPEERDYSGAIGRFRESSAKGFGGSCVYCNHCLPCPSNIDIAAVNKYLDIALLNPDNVPPSVRQHYKALSAHGGDCVACGSCEGRCPFSVSVIANMEKAKEIFGE